MVEVVQYWRKIVVWVEAYPPPPWRRRLLAVHGQGPTSEQSQASDSRCECQQSHEEIAGAHMPNASEWSRNERVELKAPRKHQATLKDEKTRRHRADRLAEKDGDVCEGEGSR